MTLTSPFTVRPLLSRPAAVDLKTSLMARIVAVALLCFALAMTMVLFETRWERQRLDHKTAQLVAKHLELQRLRIESDYEASVRFPDWSSIVTHVAVGGQCIRFEDTAGALVRSDCIGSVTAFDTTPGWFALLYGLLFPAEDQVGQPVIHKDQTYGMVLVSSDATAAMAHSWQAMRQMLSLTAILVLALCLLVYVAVQRALAPTRQMVAGLNRLAGGDLGYRLPAFHLSELQRIGEVANHLAERVQVTLGEHADLSKRLMNAQEQERRHLARELHDEFAQNLTAIGALAASIKTSAERDCPALRVEAEALTQISRTMMASLRGTLHHLRPADLDRFGLAESLRQLVALWNVGRHREMRVELKVDETVAALGDDVAIHVFRIAQEGLTNAAKHSEAGRVRLSLAPVRMAAGSGPAVGGIELVIEDDGAGRHDDVHRASGQGMGILNMRERVAALGGTIAFEDRAGAGLIVRVRIPAGDGRA